MTTGKLASGAVAEGNLSAGVLQRIDTLQPGGTVRVDASNALESAAPAHTLIQRGPFTIYAKCFNGGGMQARVYASTSASGALMLGAGPSTTFPGGSGNGYLNPNTAENKRIIGQSGAVLPTTASTLAGGATLILGTTSIQVGVVGFIKGAEVASDSNNYGGGGARCAFTSYLIATS